MSQTTPGRRATREPRPPPYVPHNTKPQVVGSRTGMKMPSPTALPRTSMGFEDPAEFFKSPQSEAAARSVLAALHRSTGGKSGRLPDDDDNKDDYDEDDANGGVANGLNGGDDSTMRTPGSTSTRGNRTTQKTPGSGHTTMSMGSGLKRNGSGSAGGGGRMSQLAGGGDDDDDDDELGIHGDDLLQDDLDMVHSSPYAQSKSGPSVTSARKSKASNRSRQSESPSVVYDSLPTPISPAISTKSRRTTTATTPGNRGNNSTSTPGSNNKSRVSSISKRRRDPDQDDEDDEEGDSGDDNNNNLGDNTMMTTTDFQNDNEEEEDDHEIGRKSRVSNISNSRRRTIGKNGRGGDGDTTIGTIPPGGDDFTMEMDFGGADIGDDENERFGEDSFVGGNAGGDDYGHGEEGDDDVDLEQAAVDDEERGSGDEEEEEDDRRRPVKKSAPGRKRRATSSERPVKKVGRPAKTDSQSTGPRGKAGSQKPINKRVSQLPSELDMDANTYEGDFRMRRSGRRHFAPLQFWKGERFEYTRGQAVPIIEVVSRIPDEPVKPLSIRRTGAARSTSRGRSLKRGSTMEKENNNNKDDIDKDDKVNDKGIVLQFPDGNEVERRIAYPRSELLPVPVSKNGNSFKYQKVFGEDQFIAAGVVYLPVKGEKPAKQSKDNSYVFYVIKGVVHVKIHKNSFIMSRGSMFMVPRGNIYSIHNACETEVELFFAQARKLRLGEPEENLMESVQAMGAAMANMGDESIGNISQSQKKGKKGGGGGRRSLDTVREEEEAVEEVEEVEEEEQEETPRVRKKTKVGGRR